MSVADIYEFHVEGLIGPVAQAALPELTSADGCQHSVLTGSAAGPRELDQILRRLSEHGLVPNHIVISPETRWQQTLPASDSAENR